MTITNFYATLRSENVISGGSQASTETATGMATFTLTEFAGDPGATTLSYNITLSFLDLDGGQTVGDLGDNVTAIHIHNLNLLANGSPNIAGDTAGTRHVLNIFGLPRADDDDMSSNAPAGTVSGLWDDGDLNLDPPGPTEKISDVLTELKSGELFIMVHNNEFSGGAIGGTLVPEPSAWGMGIVGLIALVTSVAFRRWSRRRSTCRTR